MPHGRQLDKDILYYYLNYLTQKNIATAFMLLVCFAIRTCRLFIVLYFVFFEVHQHPLEYSVPFCITFYALTEKPVMS